MSLQKIKKQFITRKTKKYYYYRVIINDCPIAVGVGDVVEFAASLIT
jgi:hypothetical protein